MNTVRQSKEDIILSGKGVVNSFGKPDSA